MCRPGIMSEIYTVQAGDYMDTIAKRYGFDDYRTIYDDPNNDALKTLRPNPRILLPGDKVFIPDKDPADHPAETDKLHKFVVKTPSIKLTLYVRRNGKPFANHKYTLKVGTKSISGQTGPDGLIQQDVPIGEALGELTFPGTPAYRRKLNLGFLHPITVTSGVQMRLNNLGFGCGPATGRPGNTYTSALQSFQKAHSLPSQTGTLDSSTINALRSEYEKNIPS
jgi:hypothetical protein